MSGPDINADRVAAKKLEEERIAFLRSCAVAFAGSGLTLSEIAAADGQGRGGGWVAGNLVLDWGRIFDAIEQTRQR